MRNLGSSLKRSSRLIRRFRNSNEASNVNQFMINRTIEIDEDGLDSTLDNSSNLRGGIRAIEEKFINPLMEAKTEL